MVLVKHSVREVSHAEVLSASVLLVFLRLALDRVPALVRVKRRCALALQYPRTRPALRSRVNRPALKLVVFVKHSVREVSHAEVLKIGSASGVESLALDGVPALVRVKRRRVL